MSEAGSSAVEMGLTLEEEGVEEQKKLPEAILPPPVKVEWNTYVFSREQELAPQKKFSDKTKNIILTPIHGELYNSYLANYLRQLNEQKGFDSEDKLGVILLINDNSIDSEERKHVIDENSIISQYISLISSKDREGIEQMDIPDEYRKLGKEIIDAGKLEIRQDYLHVVQGSRYPHFGALRSHLFKLAETFKNSSLPDSQIITHLSDVDVTYANSHFQTLERFYEDSSHQANFTEQDFIPGTQEGSKDKEDISRDLLTYLDEFRLYRYTVDIDSFLSGRFTSGTPIISGRLSYFDGNEVTDLLGGNQNNEDWALGTYMIKKETSHMKGEMGNVGEVFRAHRARVPIRSDIVGNDAEEAFVTVKDLKEGGLPTYWEVKPLSQTDEVISDLEKKAARVKNQTNPEDSHSESFKESDEYRELLQDELKQEQAKVRLRRLRLMGYIDSLAGDKDLRENEQRILDRYIEYFQEESDAMKQQLTEGKTPEQVAVSYIQKYDSFFNPDTSIHTQIARLRALKKYSFAHNLRS